jgi:4-hydroxythreonine-4-phosphate dehydrogenase
MMTAPTPRPRLATILGDPAGIGPELVARLLADESTRAQADFILFADPAEADRGMDIAGRRYPYRCVSSLENPPEPGVPLLFAVPGDGAFARCEAAPGNGRHTLTTMEMALGMVQSGRADAFLYAPLNKAALHMADMKQKDDLHWMAEFLGHAGPMCELNTMDDLWTARVTSHIALADVAPLITGDRILERIRLMHEVLRDSGLERPRVAVCGLNPHNGDLGAFGREEIEVIAPAVARARAEGLAADGPFPADTIFLKVFGKQREYDGIVTMYHDQGQIAMKLMGFWRGVTVQGGLPVPTATPAHGTAFDISQKGVADIGPMRQAFNVALRLAAARIRAAST